MTINGNCTLGFSVAVTESGEDYGKPEHHAPSYREGCYATPANCCHVGELVLYCHTFSFLRESGNRKFYAEAFNF